MDKNRHLRGTLTLLAFLFCCIASLAEPNMTLKVNIGVELLDNGDAIVSEERVARMGSYGTEGYIAQYNLRPGMKITDLQVSDETGTEYDFEDKWNVNRSRAEKANKCGYNWTDKGVELCWGIGEEGLRTYYIRYRIVGLLMGYKESDGFNHCFFSTDTWGVDSVSVVFYREGKEFQQQNPNIWMFGCYGTIDVMDGVVQAYSTQRLSDNEKVIVMMEFPKGEFHPDVNVDGEFKTQVKDIAMEGSDYYEEEIKNNPSLFKHIEKDSDQWMFALGGIISLVITTLIGGSSLSDVRKRRKKLESIFGKKKEVLWNRVVPVDGDLLKARGIYNAVEQELLSSDDTIAAYTLRLMLKKKIEIRRRTYPDNTYQDVLLVNTPGIHETGKANSQNLRIENEIHKLYYDAAGEDHLLEPNEIRKYFNENPVKYRSAVRGIDRILQSTGTMSLDKVEKDEALAVLGFEKFLKEFTLLSERGTMEATLWKDYMVFATLFGISKRVAKELRAMLPEMPVSDVELYNAISDAPLYYYAATSLNSGINHVRVYKTPAEIEQERRESRSSGGGGHSSYSGGGGHSGGGGSGFR